MRQPMTMHTTSSRPWLRASIARSVVFELSGVSHNLAIRWLRAQELAFRPTGRSASLQRYLAHLQAQLDVARSARHRARERATLLMQEELMQEGESYPCP